MSPVWHLGVWFNHSASNLALLVPMDCVTNWRMKVQRVLKLVRKSDTAGTRWENLRSSQTPLVGFMAERADGEGKDKEMQDGPTLISKTRCLRYLFVRIMTCRDLASKVLRREVTAYPTISATPTWQWITFIFWHSERHRNRFLHQSCSKPNMWTCLRQARDTARVPHNLLEPTLCLEKVSTFWLHLPL